MIFTRLGPDAAFYRALTPRWAYMPESGAGAALVGGRFNRPGVEARYLAETAEGALIEYQQESPLLQPSTLATYLVTAARVVDFSGGYSAEHWSALWAEAYCNWKGLAFLENVEPPSWVIGDVVRAAVPLESSIDRPAILNSAASCSIRSLQRRSPPRCMTRTGSCHAATTPGANRAD